MAPKCFNLFEFMWSDLVSNKSTENAKFHLILKLHHTNISQSFIM